MTACDAKEQTWAKRGGAIVNSRLDQKKEERSRASLRQTGRKSSKNGLETTQNLMLGKATQLRMGGKLQ